MSRSSDGTDYLLTWNCKHVANAEIPNLVGGVAYHQGYGAPVICTPEELMERRENAVLD